MATTVAVLEAKLTADTRDFDRAMGKSDSTMNKVGRTAMVAGAAIATGLAVAARVGFREFVEGEKVTAQTNAVIRSTAGVANVTARELDRLGLSMMKKTGIDDEQIRTGANMLLTFTRIRNEVGAGNDIFTQATKVTTDLSVAMGKDMQSSAILVGKALNDPIKGLTALTRVGVSFTEQQKDAIKAMVASGDTMGAQKLIIAELTTEFGGSAEAAGKTFAGQVNILRESFSNLMGQIVGGLMPALLGLAQHMQRAVTWLQENEKAAKILMIGLGVLAGALIAARVAQMALNLAVLANPYVAVAALLAALVVGVVIAYQRSDQFRESLNNLWAKMRDNPIVSLTGQIADLSTKLSGADSRSDFLGKTLRAVWEVIRDGPIGQFVRDMNNIVEGVDKSIQAIKGLGDEFKRLSAWIDKVVDGIRWLINKIPDIPKMPSLPNLNPFGDPRDPTGTGPSSISPALWDELGSAGRFGLTLTSGYRPGAITANGTPSDHGTFPSKAIDVAGPSSSMGAFFRSLIGNRGVKQAFFDPFGSIFGGVLSSYREGGHSDHVHVATYDQGGYLRPGWNLAYNGLGRPEPVGAAAGGPQTIVVQLGDATLATLVRNAKGKFEQRNGPGSF